MNYEESKQELIADLKSMPQNSDVIFLWGSKSFTAETLRKEIEDETGIGKEHIKLHIETMDLIQKLLAELKAKKERRWGWIKKLKFW